MMKWCLLDPGLWTPSSNYMGLIPICIQDGDRGGSEEPTKAYYEYVEESDAATTKVYA
jgi:hypothetical protein